MTFCTNCGQPLEPHVKFCSECGTATNKEEQKSPIYDGEIHKCPNCGEILESFMVNCPTCGYEIRGTKSSDSIREFALKLEEIENSRRNKKLNLKRVFDNKTGVNETDKQKISLIRSFVIPNTKEDLFEFLVLASSNISKQRYNKFDPISETEQAVSDAWEAKFEQAYEKAKISFGNTQEFKKIQAIYDNKKQELNKNKRKGLYLTIGLISSLVLFMCVGWIFIISMASSESREIKVENERLESIVIEVYDALEAGNYVLARAKASSLTFSGPDTAEADKTSEKWDKTRNELLATINDAEKDKTQLLPNDNETSNDVDHYIEFETNTTNEKSTDDDKATNRYYEVSENTNVENSVDITIQANDYLDVKEFAWFMNNEFLKCVITITNKSNEYAIEYPAFRITAYDKNNKVLGTEEQTLSVIYPSQDFSAYCLLFELSQKPQKIAITLLKPDDYNIIATDKLDYPTYKQMVGENISINKESITGEIFNPNSYGVDSAMITIIFRDENDKIVFGEQDFVDQIPAGDTIPFETNIYTEKALPKNCEVFAYFW